MKPQRIVLVVVVVLAVAGLAAILSNPPKIEETSAPVEKQAQQAADPLSAPLIAHMRDDEGIDIGPDTSHALAISREGDQVRVVVSDPLFEKLGADLLPRLGMVERDETMSWNRYERLLKGLHDVVVSAEGGEHHHHEGEGHEPGHEEHGRDETPTTATRPTETP